MLDAFCDQVDEFRLVDDFTPVPNPVFWALGQRSLPVRLTLADMTVSEPRLASTPPDARARLVLGGARPRLWVINSVSRGCNLADLHLYPLDDRVRLTRGLRYRDPTRIDDPKPTMPAVALAGSVTPRPHTQTQVKSGPPKPSR